MPRRAAIHAGHVIAFDGRGHRLLRDGIVIVDGDRIVSVGPRSAAPVGADLETIDARDSILTPGLISTHAHIGGSPLDRSFIEGRGNPNSSTPASSSSCRSAARRRTRKPRGRASTSRWPSCFAAA